MESKAHSRPAAVRIATAIGIAALLGLLLAASATAAKRTVRDPRFDTPYLSKHARLDVVKAVATRRISLITHSVTTRARVRPARRLERPAIVINTRGGRKSAYEYIVFGSTIFAVPRKGKPEPIGNAELSARKRTWRYRFDLDQVPDLGAGYGWAALTQKRSGKVADVAPGSGYAKSP